MISVGRSPPSAQAADMDPARPEVEVSGSGGAGAAGSAEGRVADVPNPAKRGRLRSLLPAPIWHIGRLLILALIIEYLVVPQLAGPRKVAHLITEVNPFLLVAGVALEAGALLCYAQLTRTVLPAQRNLSLFTVLRIQMTTLSISHCAPGGSATGTALGYRLLTRAGVAPSDAGFALATQGIGSAAVLNILLWVALIISIPVWGFSPVYLVAALVGVVLLATSASLVFVFNRSGQRVGAALERVGGRIPFVDGQALRSSFDRVADRLQHFQRQRGLLARAGLWACANWLLDVASLAVFVGAFGHWVNPDGLLVAFGLANVLAALPITPGGLGVVEATLTSILVGFGTPRGAATLGVVSYRLINFWLPIPLGGVSYLSLQVDKARPARRRRISWPPVKALGRGRTLADKPTDS
jgi:putative heme transporter